jgi:LacI family transcriptional regulator
MTQKKTHPTLSQVARKAGVGTTTVSRVINGGERVSAKTIEHVRRVIESLGYMPNQAARTLKGHRTKTIGLIIPSIADPFFSYCAEAAQAIARAHDSLLIVTVTANDPLAEVENLKILMRHRVDGLILVPADQENSALLALLKRVTVPIVAMDRPIADANSQIVSVIADNHAGAIKATRHLIEHGYKRIACLTGESNLFTIRERLSGYQSAVLAAGLPCIIDTSITDHQSAEAAIQTLLARPDPPDAIFATKNSTTIHAFDVLKKLNVAIPESVALLGFDDFALASTVSPSISVIQQPVEEIGRRAAEILFEKLTGGDMNHTGDMNQIVLQTRLIPRASCGCNPFAD